MSYCNHIKNVPKFYSQTFIWTAFSPLYLQEMVLKGFKTSIVWKVNQITSWATVFPWQNLLNGEWVRCTFYTYIYFFIPVDNEASFRKRSPRLSMRRNPAISNTRRFGILPKQSFTGSNLSADNQNVSPTPTSLKWIQHFKSKYQMSLTDTYMQGAFPKCGEMKMPANFQIKWRKIIE